MVSDLASCLDKPTFRIVRIIVQQGQLVKETLFCDIWSHQLCAERMPRKLTHLVRWFLWWILAASSGVLEPKTQKFTLRVPNWCLATKLCIGNHALPKVIHSSTKVQLSGPKCVTNGWNMEYIAIGGHTSYWKSPEQWQYGMPVRFGTTQLLNTRCQAM